jgi:precorrin-6A/cobalt-precorrin-6A reductase
VAHDVDAAAEAAGMLGSRIFLTIGHRGLEAFAGLTEHWFLVRLIEAPAAPLPLAQFDLVLERGPFAAAAEERLLRQRRIDAVVCKNSGGRATYGKIEAARDLGLPVVMIARPAVPEGPKVGTWEQALGWVSEQLGLAQPA